MLTSSLEHESDESCRLSLASSLAIVADRMDPVDASRVCSAAIGILLKAQSEEPQFRQSIDESMAVLLPKLDSKIAIKLASDLSALIVGEGTNVAKFSGTGGIIDNSKIASGLSLSDDPEALNLILTDTSRAQRARRDARVAASAGPGLEGMLEAAARISAEPFPCRLTTQELVELLKMPTCFGGARRVVLDHLGNRYGRRFVNRWAFVRYAHEQGLDLDLTTPPKRPDPKQSVERMLEAIDQPAAGS